LAQARSHSWRVIVTATCYHFCLSLSLALVCMDSPKGCLVSQDSQRRTSNAKTHGRKHVSICDDPEILRPPENCSYGPDQFTEKAKYRCVRDLIREDAGITLTEAQMSAIFDNLWSDPIRLRQLLVEASEEGTICGIAITKTEKTEDANHAASTGRSNTKIGKTSLAPTPRLGGPAWRTGTKIGKKPGVHGKFAEECVGITKTEKEEANYAARTDGTRTSKAANRPVIQGPAPNRSVSLTSAPRPRNCNAHVATRGNTSGTPAAKRVPAPSTGGSISLTRASIRNCNISVATSDSPSHCYLPMTMFWTSTSSAVEVTSLKRGNKVLDFRGQSVEVGDLLVHDEARRLLVQLKTRATSIAVTADHRIVVPLDGSMAEKRAAELKKGDLVYCKDQPVPLEKVSSHWMTTRVVEVKLQPDSPVQTFMAPKWCMLTMGEEDTVVTDDGF